MKKLIYTLLILVFAVSLNAQWVKKADGLDTTKALNGFVQLGTNIYSGYYGGVFLSTNDGDNWSSVSSGLNYNLVLALAGSGNNLYAGTYGGGVYRSTNSGTNWNLSGLSGSRVWSVCVKGTNVYAGLESGGLFVSSDSGATWSYANLGVSFIFSLAYIDNNIFAGTRSGIYRSTDNGNTWSNVYYLGIDVGCVAANGSNIFAGMSGGQVFINRQIMARTGLRAIQECRTTMFIVMLLQVILLLPVHFREECICQLTQEIAGYRKLKE